MASLVSSAGPGENSAMVCRSFSGSIAAGSQRGAAAAVAAPPAAPAPCAAAAASSPSTGAAGVRGALAAS
eukprot:8484984-Pyramimonas_sp.AAC.1